MIEYIKTYKSGGNALKSAKYTMRPNKIGQVLVTAGLNFPKQRAKV